MGRLGRDRGPSWAAVSQALLAVNVGDRLTFESPCLWVSLAMSRRLSTCSVVVIVQKSMQVSVFC